MFQRKESVEGRVSFKEGTLFHKLLTLGITQKKGRKKNNVAQNKLNKRHSQKEYFYFIFSFVKIFAIELRKQNSGGTVADPGFPLGGVDLIGGMDS